jgi:hypothetical protein
MLIIVIRQKMNIAFWFLMQSKTSVRNDVNILMISHRSEGAVVKKSVTLIHIFPKGMTQRCACRPKVCLCCDLRKLGSCSWFWCNERETWEEELFYRIKDPKDKRDKKSVRNEKRTWDETMFLSQQWLEDAFDSKSRTERQRYSHERDSRDVFKTTKKPTMKKNCSLEKKTPCSLLRVLVKPVSLLLCLLGSTLLNFSVEFCPETQLQ